MWLRKDHYYEGGFNKSLNKLTWNMIQGMKLHHLCRGPKTIQASDLWHGTRIVEYPVMLRELPPQGNILDVGANPQFALCLLEGGEITEEMDLWLHHTSHDVGSNGLVHTPKYGPFPTDDFFRRMNGKWKMFFGDPGSTDLLDGYFDVMYNVSVMEHVEPENQRRWMEGLWRWLKPGGKMMLSCDYLPKEPLGGGRSNAIMNHDFEYVLSELGGELFAGDPAEIPWHKEFDQKTTENCYVVTWDEPGGKLEMSVYFWGVGKPS